jgi:hypothetical protein
MLINLLKGDEPGRPALDITCQKCGTEYESPYEPGKIVKWLEGFNQYENFPSDPCPNCGAIEVFNMDLTAEEITEEYFEKMGLPEKEKAQRRNLSVLMSDLKFE